jgi:hypothetical protein
MSPTGYVVMAQLVEILCDADAATDELRLRAGLAAGVDGLPMLVLA